MQVKLKKHASRIEEAISLCTHVVSNQSYETIKQRIIEKYRFEIFDVEKIMDDRIAITRAFKRDFKDKTDLINEFFSLHSDSFSLARLFMKMPYFQAEKRKCRAVFDEDENRIKIFLEAFKELSLIDEAVNHEVNAFEELTLLLEKMDIEDEDKWFLQRVYLHLDQYIKRFCNLVNQVSEWLLKYEDMICLEEKTFIDYWSDFISKESFANYVATKLNFDVASKTSIIWVVPAYFACHSINYEYRQYVLYVYVGTIFDESFSFEKKYETPGMLCTHLRLLSDTSKFEIIRTLKKRAYYGSELAKEFHLSTPTISHHMSALVNAGFVKTEKKDNKTFYILDSERLNIFLSQIHYMLLEEEQN